MLLLTGDTVQNIYTNSYTEIDLYEGNTASNLCKAYPPNVSQFFFISRRLLVTFAHLLTQDFFESLPSALKQLDKELLPLRLLQPGTVCLSSYEYDMLPLLSLYPQWGTAD